MKKHTILAVFMLCILLLAGCTSKSQKSQKTQESTDTGAGGYTGAK